MSLLFPHPSFPSLKPHLPISPSPGLNPINPSFSSIHIPPTKALPFSLQASIHLTNSLSVEQSSLHQSWLHLLQACIEFKDLGLGLSIHAFLIKSSRASNGFHGNNLINMYSKFGLLDSALQVFDQMPQRDTFSWTSLIHGYSSVNDFKNALRISQKMHASGEKFNQHTCSCVLRASKDLPVGEQIHALAAKIGVDACVAVGTSLVSMYASNGKIESMEFMFDEIIDVDTWCLNSLILDYKRNRNWAKAFLAFRYVLESGLDPNEYTFTNTLSACDECADISAGRQIHALAIKYGALCELSVGNSIVMMYVMHGLAEDAEKAFDIMKARNLVTWTAILPILPLCRFKECMIEFGVALDSSCFSTVLDVCSRYKDLKLLPQIHACVLKLGFSSDDFVSTALADAYVKCGRAKAARLIFDSLPSISTASFNVLLDGSLETHGAEDSIMVLLSKLRSLGMKPDAITIAQLQCISANQTSTLQGKAFHAHGIKTGLDKDIRVGNAVISMYGKCGCIEDASAKFNEMARHDNVSYNAIISAHAIHGRGTEALLCYESMIRERAVPDESTAVSILQACSYSGYLDEGIRIFQSIGIKPVLEHQVCLVDLLGRRGDTERAMKFVEKSEFRDEPMLWRSLVNACKFCGDLRLGMLASGRLIELAPDDPASYILISNMFSEGGMPEEANQVRAAMRRRKLRKEPGQSWVSVENQVHYFKAGGMDHLKCFEIHQTLLGLSCHLKEFDNCSPQR